MRLSFTLLLLPALAYAGPPLDLELRGGGSVWSGPEDVRVQYLGDNDSLGFAIAPNGLPFDRWVTNGTKLLARWDVTPTLTPVRGPFRLLVNASLGQSIYTPRTAHVDTVAELGGDRPYSGWLNASLGADLLLDVAPLAFTRGGTPYTALGLELFAGAQGPWSLAGFVQYNAHFTYLRVQGQPMPPLEGWGVAETKPGLTGDATAYAETTLAAQEYAAPEGLRWTGARPGLLWLVGGRVDGGSMLDAASVQTTLVAGLLGDPLARRAATVPLAAYLVLRGELRGVAWNASIDRPLLDGSVAAHHAPLVAELSVSAVVRAWVAEVGFAQVYRSNETATLPGPLKTGQLIGMWSFSVAW